MATGTAPSREQASDGASMQGASGEPHPCEHSKPIKYCKYCKPERFLSAAGVNTLGVFLLLSAGLLFYLFLGVWPWTEGKSGEGGAWTGQLSFPGLWEYNRGPEFQLLLVVAVSGALGGVIHAGFSFTSFVGGDGFRRDGVWWSIFRAPLGAMLAVVFIFAIRAGVLVGDAKLDSVNPFGVAAISGLVGMFSREAKEMLQRTFDALFKAKSNNSNTSGDAGNKSSTNTQGGQGGGMREGQGSGVANDGKEATQSGGQHS